MSKEMEAKALERLREAFKDVALKRFGWEIDRGAFDSTILSFTDGDTYKLKFAFDLLPTDIIFMRKLAGFPEELGVFEKVKAMWNEE